MVDETLTPPLNAIMYPPNFEFHRAQNCHPSVIKRKWNIAFHKSTSIDLLLVSKVSQNLVLEYHFRILKSP